MTEQGKPKWYLFMQKKHPEFINAVENLGEKVREEGPLEQKEIHLIQLAAAAAIRSEGAVHSHVRRALQTGASPEEIYHTIIVLTSTIGFPTVAAALSWAEDIIAKQ